MHVITILSYYNILNMKVCACGYLLPPMSIATKSILIKFEIKAAQLAIFFIDTTKSKEQTQLKT